MTEDWAVQTLSGSVAEFHARPIPEPAARTLWFFEPTDRAIVLGSTQKRSTLDLVEVADRGLDVVRRHSGGGAVVIEPGASTWFDVVLPTGDPWWQDDVTEAARWLGWCCADALRSLGIDASDPARRTDHTRWSPLVCFAGVGAGEVEVSGAKVLGISQRRTRRAARFQVVVLHHWSPGEVVPLFSLSAGDQVELLEVLGNRAAAVTCDTSALRSALVTAIARDP